MGPSGPLALTRNLISLERGGDELLLVNSFHMRTMYVARGKERVKRLLTEAGQGLTLEGLKSAFPHDADLIQLLRDYRILVDASEDKECFEHSEIAAADPRPKPRMTVYLLITEACNLGCIYCLNGAGTYLKDGRSKMSPTVAIQSVIDCLEQISTGGRVEVGFFGGEPMLQWPLIKEIIRRCEDDLKPAYHDKQITYHLTSNLTICPPDLIEVIRRHNITVMSDIDGPPEIHNRCRPYRHGKGSHAQTAATIRRLAAAGIPVSLRATITSVNQDYIMDTVAHHKELGGSTSAVVPACPINSDREFLADELLPDPNRIIAGLVEAFHSGLWDKENLFPFNQYIAKLRPGTRQVMSCAAFSGTIPVIRVNADVYPCIYLVGQEKCRLGTAGTPWDRRWLDETLLALHVDNLEECNSCPWRYACGGGCPLTKLARWDGVASSPKAAEYARRISCDFTKAVLTEMLWDLADEARTDLAGGQQQAALSAPESTLYC
ncbi:MAG: radical SAM protein [Deltaproteobacteria bacterium]|nr:radical SAM protein [Deltaproteobacteria bacterium]